MPCSCIEWIQALFLQNAARAMAVPNPHCAVALPIGPQEDKVSSIRGIDVQTAVAARTRTRVDQVLA
ncbi:MAG: hypothetical protein OXI35_08735, partial [Gemmatimonadota bacterium]|nr:hypothetical protein [Gemmatimonadota bacterium]